MPIRTQCPSCKAALNAPEGPAVQKVRCPHCMSIFTVGRPAEPRPAEPPSPDPLVLPSADYRAGAARRPVPPRREDEDRSPRVQPAPERRRSVAPASRRSGLPVGLLIGVGGGLAGLFLIAAGALTLYLVLRSSRSPSPESVAPVVTGEEEFVDLPERGTEIPEVAGLDPGKPQGAPAGEGAPGGRPRVVLVSARVGRVGGQPNLHFEIRYRVDPAAPMPAGRGIFWVIVAGGRSCKHELNPNLLRGQGTLSSQVSRNLVGDGPYQTFLAVETRVPGRPGVQEQPISNVLTLR